MKKTTLTLGFLCCFLVAMGQADLLVQRIDFSCKNKSLKNALRQLKKETGLRFSYADKQLSDQTVSLNVKDKEVSHILRHLLQQNELTYKVSNQKILIVAAPPPTKKKDDITVRLKIRDVSTHEPLAFATVTTNKQAAQMSNIDGDITLKAPRAKSLFLAFSYIGYSTAEHYVSPTKDTTMYIELHSDDEHLLPEIVISCGCMDVLEQASTASVTDILDLSVISNRKDIIKNIQLLPGVQSGNEDFSSLQIRGGSTDQNLILLDGAPVYNASHLGGIFSIFNENSVGNINLFKNELPARYGGRLSSVLDVKTRSGNFKYVKAKLDFGLLSSSLLLEGPIKRDKTSFLLAFRRTWLDALILPLSRRWLNSSFNIGDTRLANNGEVRYSFYDINAKISHRFSLKDHLSFSIYNGGDSFAFTDESDSVQADEQMQSSRVLSSLWGNTTASLNWNHFFADEIFLKTNLNFTNFTFDYFDQYAFLNTVADSTFGARFIQNYTSAIQDISFKNALKLKFNNRHQLEFGVSAIQHRFKPGIEALTEENTLTLDQIEMTFDSPILKTYELVSFIESRHTLWKYLRLHTGLRGGAYLLNKKAFPILEPRLALNAQLTKKLVFKSNYIRTSQALHLLTNSGIELPTDLWVPATANVSPERSWQAGMGLIYSDNKLKLSADVYYRKMDSLIAFIGEETLVLSGRDWQDKITQGTGEAYGLELAAHKKSRKTSGVAAYTLAWSNRQFGAINEGQKYPFKYDRRHSFSIALKHRFSKRFTLKTDWVYSSGNPFTRPIQEAPVVNPLFPAGSPATVYIYEAKNSSRMPAFHRLNISTEWRGQAKHFSWLLNLGVFNAYNRKNPFLLYLGAKEGTNENQYKQLSLMPILPQINCQIEF